MKTKLPEGWEEVELGEVCELIMGQSPPGESYNEIKNGTPFFQGKAEFNNRYPTIKKWTTQPCKLAKPNDILMSVRAPVGSINICNVDCCIGRGLAAIRCRNNVIYEYLYLILNFLEEKICNLGTGSTFKSITSKQLSTIKIPLPPPSTQKKIVSILEKAEKAKEWRKEADKLTNDFLKAVFMEMFLSDKDKFQVKELNEVCETSSGGTPSRDKKEYWENGTILWVKSGELDKGYIYDTEEKITENGLEKSSAKYFDPETVLLAMYGATVGKAALLKVKATTNQAICGIKPKNNSTLNSIYLLHILFSLKEKLISKSIGGGQPNISQSIIKETKIPIPPLSLQHKFASIVRGVEQMKEQQKYSKEQIDNLFNALMQKAFKGELVI